MSTAARPARPGLELLYLALWMLATIALRPYLLPDEGRYALVAFEMLHGDPVVPTLNGLPFFHKPPLLYWLDIGAMQLLGVHQFSARLGPALLAWGLGAALWLHMRRWHGVAAARCALVVLATSPFFFIGGQYVNHDIGVAACITAAVLAIVRAVEDPQRTDRRWLLAGWALCGLGVLAKGLIGIVLPALIIGPWLLAQGRWRQMLGLLHPLGLLVFAAVVLPWMAVMQSRYPGFFDYFIVEQHFRRFSGTTFNNRQPFWFYFAVLPLLMLPWSLWLWPALRHRAARTGLYLWWVAAIVGFFSLPNSKLVGYILPALAPTAALLALALLQRGTPWPRVAAGAATLCLAAVLTLAWRAPGSHRDLGLALGQFWRPGDRLVFNDEPYFDVRLYAQVIEPAIVLSNWGDPSHAWRDDWRKELLDATRFAPELKSKLLWTSDRVPELACLGTRVWVVSEKTTLPQLAALPGLQTVYHDRHDVLLRLDPQPGCTPAKP